MRRGAGGFGSPSKTCDGKTATNSATTFSYAIEFSNTKCLAATPSYYANSKSDADACAQKDYPGYKIGASRSR